MASLSPAHHALRHPPRLLRHDSRAAVSSAPRPRSNLVRSLWLSPLTSTGPSPSVPRQCSRLSPRRISSSKALLQKADQSSRKWSSRGRAAAKNGPEAARPSDPPATESVDVLIAGGGVAGLATALALHRVGIHVAVVERAPALAQSGAALSLWGNAWRALDALGVAVLLRGEYVRLEGIDIAAADGSALRSFDFADCNVGPDHEVRGVTRAHLLSCMASQLPPGTIRFATTITHIPEPTSTTAATSPVTVTLSNGASIEAKALIGCDGDASAVASWLGLLPTNYAGYRAARGVAELDSADPVFATASDGGDAGSADVAGSGEGGGGCGWCGGGECERVCTRSLPRGSTGSPATMPRPPPCRPKDQKPQRKRRFSTCKAGRAASSVSFTQRRPPASQSAPSPTAGLCRPLWAHGDEAPPLWPEMPPTP
ncbi:hypothetical protein CLOM_g4760 [Closterium sp. NIES-68]|nr:hypothetical protein CLOM_g4760 [Closterium sp. NIES-68]